jgi:predicted DNA-binding ribbon-helix-helix protein
MKSTVAKRSIVLAGHKTSISLEDAFWRALKDIASSRRTTLRDLINSIDTDREQGNLSSAIRLFVLNHYKAGAASHLSDSRPSAIIAHASH